MRIFSFSNVQLVIFYLEIARFYHGPLANLTLINSAQLMASVLIVVLIVDLKPSRSH